jgi:hypothetical protein
LIADWDVVSELRRTREAASGSGVSQMVWVVAVVGFAFVIVPYFVFPPTLENLFLLLSYSSYIGLVLFVLWGLDSPFSLPITISSDPFQALLDSM